MVGRVSPAIAERQLDSTRKLSGDTDIPADPSLPRISHHCPHTPKILVGTKLDMRKDPQTLEKMRDRKQQPIEYSQVRLDAGNIDKCGGYGTRMVLTVRSGRAKGVSMANQINAAKVSKKAALPFPLDVV